MKRKGINVNDLRARCARDLILTKTVVQITAQITATIAI